MCLVVAVSGWWGEVGENGTGYLPTYMCELTFCFSHRVLFFQCALQSVPMTVTLVQLVM